MYRFIDRPVATLHEHHRFLLGAVRQWTMAARAGRCRCRRLSFAFAHRGVAAALPHFDIAMATLDREAGVLLRFGALDSAATTDDEARVLALFDAALAGEAARARRIAAALVDTKAATQLTTAAGLVAMHLAQTIITEEDE